MLDLRGAAIIRTHRQYRGCNLFAQGDAVRLRDSVRKLRRVLCIPAVQVCGSATGVNFQTYAVAAAAIAAGGDVSRGRCDVSRVNGR